MNSKRTSTSPLPNAVSKRSCLNQAPSDITTASPSPSHAPVDSLSFLQLILSDNLDKLCAHHHPSWSDAFRQGAIAEYARFFHLKQHYRDHHCKLFSPSGVVDEVWHLHILDTVAYQLACQGDFIHHDPLQGLHPLDPISESQRAKRYENTLRMYADHYQVSPPEEYWPKTPPAEDQTSPAPIVANQTTEASVNDNQLINIIVSCNSMGRLQLRARKTLLVSRLVQVVGERYSLKVDDLAVFFAGGRLSREWTLEEADVMDGDEIDVFVEQRGC